MAKKTSIPGWPDVATSAFADFANPLGQLPLANNALANSFTGGFEFVKSLWGAMPAAVPGFVVPTIDLEELDKRITDLKAVESWLAMNANMLRATVQSLEVQRSTVAALQAMTGGLSAASRSAPAPSAGGTATPAGHANWPKSAPTGAPFSFSGNAVPEELADPGGRDRHKAPPARRRTQRPSRTSPSPEKALDPAAAAAGWLGFLQDQFNQVAQAAAGAAAEPALAPNPDKPVATRARPTPGIAQPDSRKKRAPVAAKKSVRRKAKA